MKEDFILENSKLRLVIDGSNGQIKSFTIRDADFDICRKVFETDHYYERYDTVPKTGHGSFNPYELGSRIGGIKIFDELKKRWYSDLEGKYDSVECKAEENKVTVDKHFKGADFKVRIRFVIREDHLDWSVSAAKERGRDRSVRIHFFLPLPIGWMFWAPAATTPFRINAMVPFCYTYPFQGGGATPYSIGIPCASIYLPRKAGVTLFEPFEREKPGVKIFYNCFVNNIVGSDRPTVYYEDSATLPYLEVSNFHIGLRRQEETVAELMIVPHEGDWRPGLGWIFNRYKEYFFPECQSTWEKLGLFICWTVHDEDFLKRMKELGLKTMEVHGTFPFYGLYAPGEESWATIGKIEGGHYDEHMTYQKIRDWNDKCRKYGVSPFIYGEFREALIEFLGKDFPEAIVRDEKGYKIVAWMEQNYLTIADPDQPFGKYILDQYRKLCERTDPDGLFIDGFKETVIDFSKDDGVTMVNNKPCYSYQFSYPKMMAELAKIARTDKRQLYTVGNKPLSAESQLHLDVIMVEAEDPAYCTKLSYIALGKPIIFLFYQVEDIEDYLKLCLRWGAFPSVARQRGKSDDEWWESKRKLYNSYLRLIELLSGRQWVFDPNPVVFPHNVDGNIFRTKDGYVVTLLSKSKSIFDDESCAKDLAIRVDLKDSDKITTAYLYQVDRLGREELKVERKGSELSIDVPRHGVASAIVLEALPNA